MKIKQITIVFEGDDQGALAAFFDKLGGEVEVATPTPPTPATKPKRKRRSHLCLTPNWRPTLPSSARCTSGSRAFLGPTTRLPLRLR